MGALLCISLLFGIVGHGLLSSPFREGIEYKYDWKASAKSGADIGPQIAGLSIKGKIYVHRLPNAAAGQQAVFKLKEVTWGIYNGEQTSQWPLSHMEMTDLSSQLEKPFVVTYNSTQVAEIAFDKNEHYWSANLKKSIASQFQFMLPASMPSAGSQTTFVSNENNLFGACKVFIRLNAYKTKVKLYKDLNTDECTNKPFRWRSISKCKPCNTPSAPLNTLARSSYDIAWSKGHPEISTLHSEGTAELTPFGSAGATQFHHVKYCLKKTKRISSQELETAEYVKGDFRFNFGRNLSAFDNVDYRAKAQPVFHHHQDSQISQEMLRNQAFIELIEMTKTTTGSNLNEKIESNSTVGTNTLPPILASLDYKSLVALHKELSISSSNEQLTSARNIFYDVLLMGGSNPGALFLLDLIKSDAMDSSRSARIISLIPIYLKESNTAIANELKEICIRHNDLTSILAKTSLLAYGTTVHKLFLVSSDKRMRDSAVAWLETRFKESMSVEAKIAITQTLDNLGSHDSNLLLETLAEKAIPVVLRAKITWVVGKASSGTADTLLLNIVADNYETTELRLTACAAILRSDRSTTVNQLLRIVQRLSNTQLKALVHSHLSTLRNSKNSCDNHQRNAADNWLKAWKNKKINFRQSSVDVYEFKSDATNLGAQMSITRLISGEDSLPITFDLTQKTHAYGYECETFSLSMRVSGLSHWMIKTFDSMRAEGFTMNVEKIKDLLADLHLKPRSRAPVAIDINLALHGYHVFQYHFNSSAMDQVASLMKDLEFLRDSTTNVQRVISTGNGLFTTCNHLGFPLSAAVHLPILISSKVAITRPRNTQKLTRTLSINYYQEARAEHTLVFHMVPLDTLQAVTHSRKTFINVPAKADISVDFRKLHLEVLYYTPDGSDTIGVFASGQTVVVTRTSNPKLMQTCPNCPVRQLLSPKPISFKPSTVILGSSTYLGAELTLQTVNCDFTVYTERYPRQLFMWMQANPDAKVLQNLFMLAAETQESLLIQPQGTFCQTYVKLRRTATLPTLEASAKAKLKLTGSETPGTFGESGKIAFGLEILLKGQLKNQDRRSEFELVYEYEGGETQANISVRWKLDAVPALNMSAGMLCLKGDIKYPTPPVDLVDVSDMSTPSLSIGNIEVVAGRSTSLSNQCPVNGFRLRGALKSTSSAEEFNLYKTRQQWPYGTCRTERVSSEWANHVTPQTEACYRTALQLTRMTGYVVDLRLAEVPSDLSNMAQRAKAYLSLMYPTVIATLGNSTKDGSSFTDINFNVSVKPDDQVNAEITYTGEVFRVEKVTLKSISEYLPSSRLSYAMRAAYELDSIPSCLVTSERIRTFDNVTYPNAFSPCYTLISSDCSDNPTYLVLGRQVNSTVKLGLKVYVGPHTIEITPESTRRASDHSVKADGIEVDVSASPYTLPEGREKYYRLRVSKKDKFYIITAPVIGITIQYSGMHITVFPDQTYRGIQCGLCGNYDGETAAEWTAPSGCEISSSEASRAFTIASNCPKTYLQASDACKGHE